MKIKKKSKPLAEGDMTPMIDMVFQLIAFFMVLINFTEVEQDQRVRLPLSELAKPPETSYEKPITLQMTKDHKVLISAQTDELTIDEAGVQLRREAQIVRAGDVPIEEVTVIIRADREAQAGKVQDLIKVTQEAGFEDFALRGRQDEAKEVITQP
jgi:biopolymer transport protein ExbD